MMKELARIVFKYDNKQNKHYINDKEVEPDVWIRTKSLWENEQSYNHLKRFVDEWGFTSHDYHTKDNVDIWVFTTVQK